MQLRALLPDEPTEAIQPDIIRQIGEVIDYRKAKGTKGKGPVKQDCHFAWTRADPIHVFRSGA